MFGEDRVILNKAYPSLVERAFFSAESRLSMDMQLPFWMSLFVSKAAENYFVAMDPYFRTTIRDRMEDSISATNQGHIF